MGCLVIKWVAIWLISVWLISADEGSRLFCSRGRLPIVDNAFKTTSLIGDQAIATECADGIVVVFCRRRKLSSIGSQPLVMYPSRWAFPKASVVTIDYGLSAVFSGLPSDCSFVQSHLKTCCRKFRHLFGTRIPLRRIAREAANFLSNHLDVDERPLATNILLLQLEPFYGVCKVSLDGSLHHSNKGALVTTFPSSDELMDDVDSHSSPQFQMISDILSHLAKDDLQNKSCDDIVEYLSCRKLDGVEIQVLRAPAPPSE